MPPRIRNKPELHYNENALNNRLATAVKNHRAVYDLKMQIGHELVNTWRSAVTGQTLSGMSRPVHSEGYARSIEGPYLDHRGAIIARATSQIVEHIENGRPQFDVAQHMIKKSDKVRMGDNGPYIYVPIGDSDPDQAAKPPAQRHAEFTRERAKRLAFMGRKGDLGQPKPPIVRGLQKMPPLPKVSNITGSVEFRTITSESHWMLPPREPNRVMDAVLEEMMKRYPQAARRFRLRA